jgi:hypothetical protein
MLACGDTEPLSPHAFRDCRSRGSLLESPHPGSRDRRRPMRSQPSQDLIHHGNPDSSRGGLVCTRHGRAGLHLLMSGMSHPCLLIEGTAALMIAGCGGVAVGVSPSPPHVRPCVQPTMTPQRDCSRSSASAPPRPVEATPSSAPHGVGPGAPAPAAAAHPGSLPRSPSDSRSPAQRSPVRGRARTSRTAAATRRPDGPRGG